jgi:putative oxygen-independent coproporphyrinogen III oxidase
MKKDFGLYIHWPFCVSKCPYCDFNSHVRASIDQDAWEHALLKELAYVGAQTKGRTLKTVFFGGGTPSLMPAKTVDALLSSLSLHWTLAPDLEITLEANPGSVDLSRFKDYKRAGVTRVSLGIQSLKNDSLRFLGRRHDRDEALKALSVAKAVFDRFSFDLIYALPNQTLDAWRQELDEALTYAGGHLSLYQLTIEKGTAFYSQHQRGDWQIPGEDLAADLYEMTGEMLGQKGLFDYEISNYAAPGQECRHNLLYWKGQDYAAIGPGAHGRMTRADGRWESRCLKAPESWITQVNTLGHGVHEEALLPSSSVFEEALLMGLRLREGVLLSTLKESDPALYDQLMSSQALVHLREEGLIEAENHAYLTASALGRQKLNSVLDYLVNKALVF